MISTGSVFLTYPLTLTPGTSRILPRSMIRFLNLVILTSTLRYWGTHLLRSRPSLCHCLSFLRLCHHPAAALLRSVLATPPGVRKSSFPILGDKSTYSGPARIGTSGRSHFVLSRM